MKGTIFSKVLSAIMAFAMIFGVCSTTISATTAGIAAGATGSAENKNQTIHYVSLGDSMSNGYGLPGYEMDSGVEDYGNGSYANQFAEWLGAEHVQLAMSAMRAEDLHWLLELDYTDAEAIALAEADDFDEEAWNAKFTTGDYWTWNEICTHHRTRSTITAIKATGYDTEGYDGVALIAKYYQDAVKNADVMSLGMGNGNFGVFMFGRILEAIGFNGEPSDALVYKVENAIRELDPEMQAKVLELKAELDNKVSEYIASDDNTMAGETVEALVNTVVYTAISYVLNYAGAVEAMLQLNPDADIILVALMNTFASKEKVEDITVGDLLEVVFTPLNAFIAALPTCMQAANNSVYADATFYYAEADNVECIVDVYAEELANEDSVVRARFVESIVGTASKPGMVWAMLGYDVYPTLAEIEAYDKLNVAANKVAYAQSISADKMAAILTYLAFEDAIVVASQGAAVSVDAILGLGNMDMSTFSSIFEAVEKNTASEIANSINNKEGYWLDVSAIVKNGLKASYVDDAKTINVHDFLFKGDTPLFKGTQYLLKDCLVDLDGVIAKVADGLAVLNGLPDYETAVIYEQAGHIPVGSSEAILNGANEIVGGAYNGYIGAYTVLCSRDITANAICDNDAIFGLLGLFARCVIGNGIGSHPSEAGHDALADAVINAYDTGYTAMDKTLENVIVVAEAIKDLVIEYHDDAYAYAYEELYNAGYIAAAQKALLDAKAEVENLQAALVSMEVDARLEETVKILDAELALIIVTIDDLYTLLDHSELTAETWALLGELCDKLARHLDNVELLVVELYGVAANEVIAIYNKVVAQLEIAVDAVKQVVTEYINKVTDFYLYIVENGQAIFEEFVNEVVKVIGYYSHEAAKACYDWLYNNPEKVIAFLAENGDDIINFIVEYGKPAFAVIGYIAQNYGEDILNFVFDNADVIIPAFVEWYNIHGEYVWDLIAVYVEAVIEIYNLDELAWEAIHKAYDEAIKYLGEILNNIVNGKYDYEDLLDAIEKIEQIIGNIDDALGGALSAIVSELKDMINQLTDKVAAEIIAKLEELENALLEILKNVADEIKESVYAELDALKEMLVNFGEYTKAEILAQLARLEDVLKAAAKELGEYVYDEAIKYIDKATKVEYTPEEDSYYVAVNGGYADYAELVAEALGITDIDYTVWGDIDYDALAAADLITIGFDENEFSAFAVEQMLAYVKNYVDVDVRNSVNDYADDVFEKLYGIPAITNRQDEVVAYINDFVDQVVNYELISDKELTDMDWAKIVGAENVEYVNAILAKLRTELVASGMVENYVVSVPVVDYIYAMYPEIETEVVFKSEVENRLGDSVVYTIEIPVADSIMFAVEAYLYSFLQFSVEYNNVVEYVNENNSDATVVLLGAYNAFCVEFAMGDVVIDLSEVYSYVAKVASIQPFVYALIDENIGYADIEDAQTWFEYYVEEGMAGNTIADFLMFYLMDNTCTDVSPAGSEYISEQILNAIVIVTDEEEVCNHEYDNACDEYCNICGEYREAAGHNFEIWWIIKPATTTEEGLRVSNCTECGFEKEIVIPVLAPVVPDEPINPDNPDDPDDPDDPDEPTNPDTPSQPTNPDQGDKDDEDDKDEDEKKGLSGGAIAGIVVGATAVAGAGGFAAYWFLVKHSTFAALGTAIAAIFSKETFAAIGAAIVGFFKKIGKFFKK